MAILSENVWNMGIAGLAGVAPAAGSVGEKTRHRLGRTVKQLAIFSKCSSGAAWF
jgi:hypothetical protein